RWATPPRRQGGWRGGCPVAWSRPVTAECGTPGGAYARRGSPCRPPPRQRPWRRGGTGEEFRFFGFSGAPAVIPNYVCDTGTHPVPVRPGVLQGNCVAPPG